MSAHGVTSRLALALLLTSALPALAAAPPPVAAPSWILMEHDSGTVLAAGDADLPRPPASLTKIMTGFVVFDAVASGQVSLDDQARITRRAWKAGRAGSRSFVRQGSKVRITDLMRGMTITSGNDSAMALAEHIAGSEAAFVARMNSASEALGLTNTVWANPTGLDHPVQRSTARDLARLTRALLIEHPEAYAYYGLREFEWDGVKQHTRNPLLAQGKSRHGMPRGYEGADGVKTGFTAAAGYCLVGSAKRGDLRLIVVVLGSASDRARAQDVRALLDWGFAEAAGNPPAPLLDSAPAPAR
jgi:D-alanyl-D-alanine carboxypeptidase (penicillin-binding protein 5/6)